MQYILKIKWFLLLFLTVAILFSCSKKCDEVKPAACSDVPPTNEACLAAFQRWFYQSGSSTCELVSYSGCGQYGFDTKEDCESCRCR